MHVGILVLVHGLCDVHEVCRVPQVHDGIIVHDHEIGLHGVCYVLADVSIRRCGQVQHIIRVAEVRDIRVEGVRVGNDYITILECDRRLDVPITSVTPGIFVFDA